MRNTLSISAMFLLLLCFSTKSFCQTSDDGGLIPPQKPYPLSIGVEGGWMRNLQSGSFMSICRCKSENGKGNSGMAAFFMEREISRYFSLGGKIGLDIKSTSSATDIRDTATIRYLPGDSVASGPMDQIRRMDVSTKYFFFVPYITITPFGSGFFVQFSPEIGSLISSNITHTRELASTTIILDNGDEINNVRFENGSNKETLEDGPIKDANKLRIAILFSAGYDFKLFEHLSIFPEASYHLPLTNVSSGSQSTDWEISSYAFSLGAKYRFD